MRALLTRADRWDGYHLLKGYHARTVIDVGVGDQGSSFLYDAFPNASFFSIDPVPEAELAIRRRVFSKPHVFIPVALGARDSKSLINVAKKISRSSMLRRTVSDSKSETVETREVEVLTLDTVFERYVLRSETFEGPVFLKVDVEGFEEQVLRGIDKTREVIDFIMIELNLSNSYSGSPKFSSVIGLLGDLGFEASKTIKVRPTTVDILFQR